MRCSPRPAADSGVGYRSRKASAISRWRSGKMALAPGQKASRVAVSWLMAATRWRTSSPRARTTARSARVASENGVSVRSWWGRSRRLLGDHLGVAGVGLGARDDLALAPGLDGVGADRDHRVAGFQQPVDQPAVGAFDRHWSPGRRTEPAQAGDEVVEPGCRVGDAEGADRLAGLVEHADGVFGRRPVDADEHEHNLLEAGGTVGEEDSAGWSLTGARGACLYCRSEALGRLERGGVLLALQGRPTLAGAPALTEPYNEDLRQPSSKQGWTSDQ